METAKRHSTIAPWALTLLKLISLLFAVSVIVFALVGLSPIDPVQANVGQAAYASMSATQKAALARYWGSDLPIWERYIHWLSDALHGDFGISLRFNQPVAEVLATRSRNSFLLMLTAWLLSGILGFAAGTCAGLKQGSGFDKFVQSYCFVLSSTPTFWLALILLNVFAVQLGWFPFGMATSIGTVAGKAGLGDVLYHLALPALTLTLVGISNIALHTREKTIDTMESDYIRFAEARGQTPTQALREHGLRNLALPAVTLQFASLSEVFGGSVLVEQVFSYPGLGQAAVIAGTGGDAALLVGIALVSALFVFGGNLLADILYRLIDPVLRRGGGA